MNVFNIECSFEKEYIKPKLVFIACLSTTIATVISHIVQTVRFISILCRPKQATFFRKKTCLNGIMSCLHSLICCFEDRP